MRPILERLVGKDWGAFSRSVYGAGTRAQENGFPNVSLTAPDSDHDRGSKYLNSPSRKVL